MQKEDGCGSGFTARKYLIEFSGAMTLYMMVLFATIGRVDDAEPGLTKLALALAPVVPLGLAFWAIMRQYNRGDELMKRMAREAFAMGAMIFGWIIIIWGFAEIGGAPRIPMIFVGPLLLGLWGLCTPIVLRRYK